MLTAVVVWSRRHALGLYFALTFLIAWLDVVIVVTPAGIPGSPADYARLAPAALIGMLLGPVVAGVAMTALTGGREGLSSLAARLFRKRLGPGHYVVPALLTPLLLGLIAAVLSPISSEFLPAFLTAPDAGSVVRFGLIAGLAAGYCEEIGWSGFAMPALRRRFGVLTTGLILGLIWGVWHVLADYWGASASFGALWPAHITLWIFALTAYRALMVRIAEWSDALPPLQLMHASFVAGQAIIGPAVTQSTAGVVWYAVFTFALWAILAVTVMLDRGKRGR